MNIMNIIQERKLRSECLRKNINSLKEDGGIMKKDLPKLFKERGVSFSLTCIYNINKGLSIPLDRLDKIEPIIEELMCQVDLIPNSCIGQISKEGNRRTK